MQPISTQNADVVDPTRVDVVKESPDPREGEQQPDQHPGGLEELRAEVTHR